VEFLTECGVEVKKAGDALVAARAKAAEFGGAVLRVLIDSTGAAVSVEPREGVALRCRRSPMRASRRPR